MLRSFHLQHLTGAVGMMLVFGALASPSLAGMTQDLADCTASDRKTSADACTRVMNSGRLPREQVYIGHYNRGWSYFNAGDYDRALADFDKSIASKPDYADTYYSRAVAQHERGDRERSLADLDEYLRRKGEVAEAYINRARLFRRRGEFQAAFSELQRAGALDPGDRKVEMLRALVLSDLGEQGPARAEAEKAVSGLPEAGAYYARALVAFRDNAIAAASADVEQALSLKDNFPAAHTLKGRIKEQQGEKDAAVASFRRALELPSKSLDARSAQDEARQRLAVLTGSSQPPPNETPDKIAASSPPPPAEAKKSDCRRFIASTRSTVAIDCPK